MTNRWSSDTYRQNAAFVPALGAAVFALLNPQPGARARGLDARVMNAERLTFAEEFDAVFSNAALHWVRDHDALLNGVHRALRPAAHKA